MKNDSLVLERTYDAPVEKVWKALTDTKQMQQWYFPMMESFEPKVGFETEFIVHHNGNDYPHMWKVTEAIPMKKIAYSWKYGGFPGNSIISFELEGEGEKTKLTLTHSVTESFESEKYPDFSKASFNSGWTHFVGRLHDFLQKQ
ncbi:MAG TPA: SRPBCC domain-containing protein [Flavobacterium sp.]|nr:SRPBCC domain-containing protein [Flavobacterium sp.]